MPYNICFTNSTQDRPVPTKEFDMDNTASAKATEADAASEELIEADLLVEELSIDGMCGVY